MIPKVIHYCWLSDDPVPAQLIKCMDTWKEVLPNYEWVKWDFNRFDINHSEWVREAFEAKKYAFAADYIRLYALYHHGGFYLDMDVIAKKSLDSFLCLHTAMCWQNGEGQGLEVAALGVEKCSVWVGKCLEYYHNRHFVKSDGTYDMLTLPLIVERHLISNGFELVDVRTVDEALRCSGKQIPVFPCDFFSPKNWQTGQVQSSSNTYLIHDFAGSWLPWDGKLRNRYCWLATNFPSLYYYGLYLPLYELKKYKIIK